MTPIQSLVKCPPLPNSIDGGVFSFLVKTLNRRPKCSFAASSLFRSIPLKIHNMNVLKESQRGHVHIMNFLNALEQFKRRQVHIMNFLIRNADAPVFDRRIPNDHWRAAKAVAHTGDHDVTP